VIAAVRALALGTGDLFRPRIFAVLAAGAALTLGLFVVLQALAFWALRAWAP
jgi:CysZ protein